MKIDTDRFHIGQHKRKFVCMCWGVGGNWFHFITWLCLTNSGDHISSSAISSEELKLILACVVSFTKYKRCVVQLGLLQTFISWVCGLKIYVRVVTANVVPFNYYTPLFIWGKVSNWSWHAGASTPCYAQTHPHPLKLFQKKKKRKLPL